MILTKFAKQGVRSGKGFRVKVGVRVRVTEFRGAVWGPSSGFGRTELLGYIRVLCWVRIQPTVLGPGYHHLAT